jgi:hypothetical protein
MISSHCLPSRKKRKRTFTYCIPPFAGSRSHAQLLNLCKKEEWCQELAHCQLHFLQELMLKLLLLFVIHRRISNFQAMSGSKYERTAAPQTSWWKKRKKRRGDFVFSPLVATDISRLLVLRASARDKSMTPLVRYTNTSHGLLIHKFPHSWIQGVSPFPPAARFTLKPDLLKRPEIKFRFKKAKIHQWSRLRITETTESSKPQIRSNRRDREGRNRGEGRVEPH